MKVFSQKPKPVIKSIQRGIFNGLNNYSTGEVANISPIDISKSTLVLGGGVSTSASDSGFSGVIDSATTIRFRNSGQNHNYIAWEIIEYA